jgi:hypothetical protein
MQIAATLVLSCRPAVCRPPSHSLSADVQPEGWRAEIPNCVTCKDSMTTGLMQLYTDRPHEGLLAGFFDAGIGGGWRVR